uniref:CBM21 domain-containing protein n=1 Tax=Anopheles christyi TaxID=43041 RepID=A0A182JX19_9DIPT
GGDDDEDESHLTAPDQHHTENTWLSSANANDPAAGGVTSLQPLRMVVSSEADSCFDFGLEAESPSSPVEECEYTRLIETATATPTGFPSSTAPPVNERAVVQAPESGYVCSSPCSTPQGSAASSHSSSSDCQFYDPDSSDPEQRSVSGCEYYDCTIAAPGGLRASVKPADEPTIKDDTGAQQPGAGLATSPNNPFAAIVLSSQTANNGHQHVPPPGCNAASAVDSDSCSESLPPSQSTESNNSTFTGMSSNSTSSTLQDVTMEPLEDHQTVASSDVPDSSAYSSGAQHRIGNGHAIMPRGTVINADTELAKLICHGLQYEDETEASGGGGGDGAGAQSGSGGPAVNTIQIAEVEKILKDCTIGDHGGERSERELPPRSNRYNDAAAGREEEEEENERKHCRRATMSSGDEDEEESKPQRIRRCSSLKTGKTPPGTPGRKKIVRFADVLGLDLTDVRTFMDEVPKVPQSAYEDLTIVPGAEQPMQPEIISLGPKADRVLVPLFQQPGALPCFLDRVRDKQVNLENAAVTDPITLTITGTVRVRNLDFHKSVYVRYTLDNWRSYADLQAVYAENSCDGFSDKFSFTLHGNSVQVGQRIEMAIRFHCRGEQFWDSNYDTNYVFQCLPITQPTPMISNRALTGPSTHPSSEPAWCSNFY